jgi:MFS family permease
VYAIASPVGCLLGGLAMDIWGRRNINMLGNVGMAVGWLLITFAEDAAMLISGRIVEGFSRSILATSITVR